MEVKARVVGEPGQALYRPSTRSTVKAWWSLPSLRATLAVLCACVARPLRLLKIPLRALNLLIILSCPFEGAHYFIDIVAGIILAALTVRVTPKIPLPRGPQIRF